MKLIKQSKTLLTFIVSALVLPAVAHGQTSTLQNLPTTKEGNYALAQQFAHCSGHFAFASLIAKRSDKKDTSTAFADMARGWKMAGMFFLAESMSDDRTPDTEKTFDYLVESKISIMRAKFELNPNDSTSEFMSDYAKNCEPLLATQKKLIEIMRRGAN